MAVAQRVDPYGAFRFMVEIGGISYGIFRECSGLSSEIAVHENPQGGVLEMQKLPARVKHSDIVLKWGLTDAQGELYDWFRTATEGSVERRNGSIVVLDTRGNATNVRWNFYQGWPSKWEGPQFNAGSDELAIQTLHITVERTEQAPA